MVADRSNNHICVFNRDYSKFGTKGTKKGQFNFNRPASVVMESRMEIFILEGWS